MLTLLKQLKDENIISAADYHFAQFIDNKQKPYHYEQGIADLAVFLAALCSYHQQQAGHSCINLDENLGVNPFLLSQSQRELQQSIRNKLIYPINEWQSRLADHIAFSDDPFTKIAPLVFQFNSLYFYRIWQDEMRVARFFARHKKPQNLPFSDAEIKATLDKLFPAEFTQLLPEEKHAWQKIAVATAIKQSCCVLTGGPGTGKTTTVTRLLLALQMLYHEKLIIKLVAPTGKAAARLKESLDNSLKALVEREHIEISDSLRESLPQDAETLHRLLGIKYFSTEPKYHAKNLLNIDVLVVDEASMIDLALMAMLVQALRAETKIILLGDQDQLSSVEAGAILAELGRFQQFKGELLPYSSAHADYLQRVTGEALPHQPAVSYLRDNLCHLVASRRFGERKLIGALAKSINALQSEESWQLFAQDTEHKEIEMVNLDFPKQGHLSEEKKAHLALQTVVERACEAYRHYLEEIAEIQANNLPIAEQLERIFKAFNQVRFLTAVRKGNLGSERLNALIFEKLKQQGLIHFHQGRENYAGKPILITQNDRNVHLYNGDIGLYLMEKNADGEIKGRYWFENGQSELPSRLPQHESAFVMTVHKSQGSEFAHTFVVLPLEFNPVLTKELLYTGVTRAKEKVTIFSTEDIWKMAVRKATDRQSGLSLWFWSKENIQKVMNNQL